MFTSQSDFECVDLIPIRDTAIEDSTEISLTLATGDTSVTPLDSQSALLIIEDDDSELSY